MKPICKNILMTVGLLGVIALMLVLYPPTNEKC